MTRTCFIALLVTSAALWSTGCSKKEEPAKPSAASTAPATRARPPRKAQTLPTAEQEAAMIHPVPHLRDLPVRPSVGVSANGGNDVELPQGLPLLIQATVLGNKGHPVDVPADSVTLKITDAKGAVVTWNPKPGKSPSTQPFPRKADEAQGVSFTWVIADTAALPTGVYRINPLFEGANSSDAKITIVAPPARSTADQVADQFRIRAQSLLAAGDADGALKLADDQMKAQPQDVLAHHLRADALAALGRREEALRAYQKALTLFTIQNPKAPEPPEVLIQAIRDLSPHDELLKPVGAPKLPK